MKKVLSLLLAVMMVVSLCPITALADDANPIELPQLIEQEEQQEEPLPEPVEEQPTEEQPQQSKMNTLDLTGEAAPLAEGSGEGGDGTTVTEPEQVDGVYQIGTAEELAWFAAKVNAGATNIDAKLVADIDLSTVCGEEIGNWTSIKEYEGTFDGNSHTISNLYVGGNEDHASLFDVIAAGGTIKNLGIVSATINRTESCTKTSSVVCRWNRGTITGCYVKDSIINSFGEIAALFCVTNFGTVSDCYVIDSTVNDQGNGILGITFVSANAYSAPNNATIANCYAVNAKVISTGSLKGTFIGMAANAGVSNCYVLDTDNQTTVNATVKTAEWFKSDEAIAALGEAWEKDNDNKNGGFPVLKSPKNSGSDKPAGKNNGIFTVQLEDGTEVYPEKLTMPETFVYNNKTYTYDQGDGFWKVVVPSGTKNIKLKLGSLSLGEGVVADDNCHIHTRVSGYGSNKEWKYMLPVTGVTYCKEAAKDNRLSKAKTETIKTKITENSIIDAYNEGWFTLPLSTFMYKRENDRIDAYGDLNKYGLSEVGVYFVDPAGTTPSGSMKVVILVQIGEEEWVDPVDRTALENLLATVEDGTTSYYTTDDFYNGKEYYTFTEYGRDGLFNRERGFWYDFTKAGGARETARKALKSAKTQEELDAAVVELQAAIDKLLPTTSVNPTGLFCSMYWIGWNQSTWGGTQVKYNDKPIMERFAETKSEASPKSWPLYEAVLKKAEALMAELYDADGNPTEANTASRQGELDALEAELTEAVKLLDRRYDKVNENVDVKANVTAINTRIHYLAKKYNPENMNAADYTAESFAAIKEARDAALEAEKNYPYYDGMGTSEYRALSNAADNLYNVCYGLVNSKENITVHFSFVDGKGAYVGYKYNNSSVSDMEITVPAGSSVTDVMNAAGASFYKYTREDNIAYVYVNGEILTYSGGTGPLSDAQNLKNIKVLDGDDIMVYYFEPKLVKYSSGAGSYPALFTDIYGWIKYATISAPEKVTAGVPFDISVSSDGAYYSTITGTKKPVANARVYTSGDSFAERNDAAKADVLEYSYINTDENGKAQITLYGEGWTAIEVYVFDSGDQGRYTHCVPVLVYVEPSDDLEGIKKTLQAELDAAWNNENYTEPVFTAENWKIYKKAYEDGTAGVTAATTGAEARKAQFTALKTMLEKQKQADSDNTNRLKNVRDCLKALPDDVTELNTSMKGRIDQMIYNYNAMSDYARSQLTVREQKKYDAIVEAYNKGLGEGSTYAVSSEIRYAGVPDADREALKNMIEYLQKNTPNDDAYTPEIGNNRIAELFSFNKGSGRNYGTQYTTVTEAKPFDSIVAPINPDYTAYLLVRNANGKLSGDGWEITDENVTIDFDPNNSNTATLVGHLTYKVNGHEYEVKGYSVQGADKSNYSVVSGSYYECSTYKGKGVNNINFYVPSALIRMDMAYKPVKLIVTWAPAGGSESELAKAKASAIEVITVEYNKYSADHEKHDAIQKAFDDGVAAVNAATTLAGVAKARTDAVKAIRAAAGIGATGEEIPGWGKDSEFNAGKQVGTVTVSLENTKYDDGYFYTEEGEKPFLYKENYPLGENDTMMSVLCRAMADEKIEWVGSGGGYEITYLSSISQTDENGVTHSLGEFDGGNESGWMGTLNDWFTNLGFSEFTVANGTLGDGDYISIKYTQSGLGADIGGTWDNSDTTLKDLVVEGGTLLTKFTSGESGKTYEYTVSIEGTSASLKVTPTATNKNFLTKIFLNEQINSNEEGASFYKRTQYIPVTSGDTIYVGCGMRAWPSMNNQSGNTQSNEGTWYVLHVVNGDDGSDYVIDLINNLPAASSINYNNYKEKNVDIEAARAAYEALTADAKAKVTNYETLTKLEAVIKSFDDVEVFKAQLAAIPSADKITLEHREAVEAAQAVYDALSETQKENLTLAEHAKMKALTERIKELEKAAAEAVDELVNKLAPVTLESGKAIEEARKAFDALTPEQKKFLDKDTESKLVSAENEYKRLVKEDADKKAAKEVEEKIAALQPVTKDSGEAIKDARSSYDALTPEQKELVSKDSVAALEKAEKAYGMIVDSSKPDASDKSDKTGSIIKISATGAAKGEQNPNTGAPAMSIAPAMLMLAAAVLVLKKRG